MNVETLRTHTNLTAIADLTNMEQRTDLTYEDERWLRKNNKMVDVTLADIVDFCVVWKVPALVYVARVYVARVSPQGDVTMK